MTYPGTTEPQRPPIIPPTQPGPPWATQPTYYPPPGPAKKKGMPTWAIVLIVVGSVVGLLCIGGVALLAIGSSASGGGAKPTVHVQACTWDGFATYATYTITNNDKKPHDYYVEGTVGHSPALPDILKNVAPGETASGKLMGVDQGDCRITHVDQQ